MSVAVAMPTLTPVTDLKGKIDVTDAKFTINLQRDDEGRLEGYVFSLAGFPEEISGEIDTEMPWQDIVVKVIKDNYDVFKAFADIREVDDFVFYLTVGDFTAPFLMPEFVALVAALKP